jgi:hemerythrin superfamily protein
MSFLLRGSKACSTNAQARRAFSVAALALSPRISDTIKKDHREIESYYDQILRATDKKEQTQFQNQFTWELARHSIGEELVVYPAFEKHVSSGHDLANKDREEHQTVCYSISSLEELH